VSDQKICPTCGTEYPLSERFCPRDGTALRSATAQADLLGQVIADRYHILKKLGEGGMGTVYLAEHVKMGRKSALKVMNPGMNTDPDSIARFNREASNASRLSHPNICGIYDFGETPDGLIYLAMEFIEGSSLTSLIEKGGSLPAPRAASIVHQTADALQVAHDAGIVHRDLKPDNIMVAKHRDGSDLVKVVDFGIAKASSSDAQKVTKTGMVVGTPEYMSPEQLAGDKLDGRSDIYSLGLVAFNCLTGALPFAAETAQEAMIMRLTDHPRTLAQVAPEKPWPEALQTTLDRALARDASDRYTSAAQFGRDFAAAIADMPMTQAVEAKTAVLGAVKAASDVPQTRVAEGRPSAATAPMPAAAKKPAPGRTATLEPVKKSAMPLMVGGGVGLAAAGVLLWQFALKEPAVTPTNTAPPAATAQDTTSQVAKSPPGADTGATQTKAPVRPLNNPGTPTGTKVPTSTPAPVPASPSAPAVTATDAWMRAQLVDLSTIDTEREGGPSADERRRANSVLRTLDSDQVRLSGASLATSWMLAMTAHAVLRDGAEVCAAAAKVIQLSKDADQLGPARFVDSNCR
jgi:eukaryotic-like serine/threonine-protein kinase